MTPSEQKRIAFIEYKNSVYHNMRDLTHRSREDLPFWDNPYYIAFYSKQHRQELLKAGKTALAKARNYHEISQVRRKFCDKIYAEHDNIFVEIATKYAVEAMCDEDAARRFYSKQPTSDFAARELFEETNKKWVYNLRLPDGRVAKIDMRKDAKRNTI